MLIDCFPCGPIRANTYLIRADGSKTCAVIDPADAQIVLTYLQERGLTLTHALMTHGHFDHIYGLHRVWQETGCEVLIHKAEADALINDRANLAIAARLHLEPTEATRLLSDGDVIQTAGLTLRVLHTPGHSKGGVCFVCEDEQLAFTGDTVFCESVGRTDMPGGDARELMRSLFDRVLALPESYRLLPGHEEETTVAHERMHNPMLQYRRHPWFD